MCRTNDASTARTRSLQQKKHRIHCKMRPPYTSATCAISMPSNLSPRASADLRIAPFTHRRTNPRTLLQVRNTHTTPIPKSELTVEFRCGEIKRLVMGLDRFNKTPCGFCFVEYYTHQDALDCLKYIGGTKLDERIIRTDLDPGFEEGRQYGYVFLYIASFPYG